MSRLSSYLKGDWSWEAAETACQKKGGHLTSITTLEKKKSVKKVLDKVAENEWISYVWLGGSDTEAEGNWSWSDKSAWGFENWFRNEPSNKTKENCLKMRPYDEIWLDERCSRKYRPLCDKEMHVFKGKLNRTWTFSSPHIPQEIEFIWKTETSSPNPNKAGFSLSWRLREEADEDLEVKTSPSFAKNENRFLIDTTNLVLDLKRKGASETEIWTDVIAHKMTVIEGQTFQGTCEKNRLKMVRQYKLIELFSKSTKRKGSLAQKPISLNEISDEDLVLGFQIYAFLTFCHENFGNMVTTFEENTDLVAEREGLRLFIFYSDIIDTMSPPNMLQTFVNMKRSTEVVCDKNLRGIKRMLEELNDLHEPYFGQIMTFLYTESHLDQISKSIDETHLKNQSSRSAGEEKT